MQMDCDYKWIVIKTMHYNTNAHQMLTTTTILLQDGVDIQWKLMRTRIWMQYVDKGSVLPPPFNLIPSYKLFPELISRCCQWLKKKKVK